MTPEMKRLLRNLILDTLTAQDKVYALDALTNQEPDIEMIQSAPSGYSYRIKKSDRDRVQSEINRNGKIAGIKLFRELTGASLRDSKDIVENLDYYRL